MPRPKVRDSEDQPIVAACLVHLDPITIALSGRAGRYYFQPFASIPYVVQKFTSSKIILALKFRCSLEHSHGLLA